jgi:hypothetical protein
VGTRIAATIALMAFAMCLVQGLGVGNPFSTVVLRALLALVVTFVVGLLLGVMVNKMLSENLDATKKQENSSS